MNAELKTARSNLTVPSLRGALPDNRVGSLVQASVRTEIDDDGNPVSARVEVDRDLFLAYLQADGSPFEAHVPETKDPYKALRAAMTRAKKGSAEVRNGEDVTETRRLWRRVGRDSAGVLKYGLVLEHPNPEDGSLSPHRVAVISVDKTGGTAVEWVEKAFQTREAEDAIDEVLKRYTRERALLHSDDVRQFVNRVLASVRAVGVGGMLHIVPRDYDQRLQTVERALIAAGYQVLIQPVTDGESVRGNVEQGLLTQVARLSREIKHLSEEWRSDEGSDVQLSTFDNRLDQIKDLAARADLFKDLIGIAGEDIAAALGDARAMVRAVHVEMLQL